MLNTGAAVTLTGHLQRNGTTDLVPTKQHWASPKWGTGPATTKSDSPPNHSNAAETPWRKMLPTAQPSPKTVTVGVGYMYSIAAGDKVITYNDCFIQVFFTDLCGVTEFFLLAAMSYDRYVAICKPLHYTTIMSTKVCQTLIISCWVSGLCIIVPPLSLGLTLKFCDSNMIDHFTCDAFPLVKISCSDTWLIEQTVIICAVLTLNVTLTCVVLSYASIIKTILRFPSVQQRKKAFSTCSSHMIVVSISYGSCIFIYIKPSAKESVAINKGVTVLTTSIAPLLNPFIYTLRNKQVKQAFNNSVKRIVIFSKK
ncbi:Olfactory receptor 6C2 [Myotis brandtii]|uniref:Olfactory receptor n=1 Tax=Myotis brandtii TaxID=109478 RepID=S7NA79_MYOBR|nr:Olfactory receptor 6C2 [Myotis brandtii]